LDTSHSELPPEASSLWTRAGSALLLVLLVVTGLGAWTFDRSSWPGFIGDEATYLMAAESLAWDGDLLYERADYDRFVARWKRSPEGLILQSGDGGESITYGKPFFYSLWLAPFVRVLPLQGPFVGNFALLLLAGLAAWIGLRHRLGPATAAYIAAFLFGSVAFASVFWIHIDLFLMTATAVAFALALPSDRQGSEPQTSGRTRWIAAGAILAMVAFSRPFYAALFLPLLALSPRGVRRHRFAFTVGGAIALIAVAVLVHQALAGTWTSYGGQRHGFYGYTGFPEIDFPTSDWETVVEEIGNAAWTGTLTLFVSNAGTSLSLWTYNTLYFLLGRHVGVLPYFLPVVLLFAGRGGDRRRRWILTAVAVGAIAFLLSRPFNFYGGGAAIANRYFLPLYPALWFAVPRGARSRWALAAMLFAAPFLLSLWTAPRAYPLDARAGSAYVTPIAKRALPYETTLDHLKPSGREDVIHNDLWIKFLTPTVGQQSEELLFAEPGGTVELILGSQAAIEGLTLRVEPGAGLPVVHGKAAEQKGKRGLAIDLGRPTARHPMWWTWDEFNLYHLRLEFPADQGLSTFSLRRSAPQ